MGLSIYDVMGEAWTIFTRNSPRLILMAAAVFGVLSLLYLAVDASDGSVILLPISAGVSILGVLSLQGAITGHVDDVREGRPTRTVGELFGAVGPVLWTLLGAEVLATIGIVGGLILLIVPGLVALTYWSGIIPAIVVERTGVLGAFRRSQELVTGNGLRVFAIIVITVLIGSIVANVIAIALSPLPRYVDLYVASVVANAVTMPYVAVAWTVMFFELRRRKEASA
jgi:hypothetical protein